MIAEKWKPKVGERVAMLDHRAELGTVRSVRKAPRRSHFIVCVFMDCGEIRDSLSTLCQPIADRASDAPTAAELARLPLLQERLQELEEAERLGRFHTLRAELCAQWERGAIEAEVQWLRTGELPF